MHALLTQFADLDEKEFHDFMSYEELINSDDDYLMMESFMWDGESYE